MVETSERKGAIVTGAGTGIGAAIAELLASQGYRIVLVGRRAEKLEQVADRVRELGGEPLLCPGDVTRGATATRMVELVGPRLDVLVHSAGQGHCLRIDELDETEWRETLDVAVTGAFLTAKAALPKLRATPDGDGYVVQVCSLASGGTWNREVGYGTAKGAQLKFALHLQEQLREEREQGMRAIHSLAVCPGTVDTPFWDRIPQRSADPELTLRASEVAWVVGRWLGNPLETAESMAAARPRPEVVVKRHPPFERFDNVVAIAHESHP